MDRNVILFGASGRIGRAFLTQLLKVLPESALHTVLWEGEARNWFNLSDTEVRQKIFAVASPDQRLDLVLAGGVIDPKVDANELDWANREFPLKLIRSTLDFENIHYHTLGTVMEEHPDIVGDNPYLISKRGLLLGLEKLAEAIPRRLNHVQLHSVYGPPFTGHMFTDQMARALKAQKPFSMSGGDQLREFHHVEDVAANLTEHILTPHEPASWKEDMSSGEPVRLKDLATFVFREMSCEKLLKVGELATAPNDNTTKVWSRNSRITLNYRDPNTGVSSAIRSFIRSSNV